MRRLLFLALFVALVAGMGFSQVTFGGLFDYGVYTDFQKSPVQFEDGKLIVTDQLDQFNTVVFRFRFKDSDFVAGDAVPTALDRFYLSTDVTGALGVKNSPVTMKLGFGFQDPGQADLTGGISPFEVADLSGNDIGGGSQPTIYPVLTFNKMYNVGAIIAPNAFNKAPQGNQKGQGYTVFANGPVGPAMAEVGYQFAYLGKTYGLQRQDAAAAKTPVNFTDVKAGDLTQPPLSILWAAVNYKGTSGPDLAYALAANGQYSLDPNDGFNLRSHYAAYQDPPAVLTDLDSVTWGYGVAASVTYKNMFTVKAGLVGLDTSLLNRAEAYAIAWLSPMFAVDAGVVLNLDSDYTSSLYKGADMINDADVGLIIQLGKQANIRIGYLYIDTAAPFSVMSDDIGRVGDVNGIGVISSGFFISSVFSF